MSVSVDRLTVETTSAQPDRRSSPLPCRQDAGGPGKTDGAASNDASSGTRAGFDRSRWAWRSRRIVTPDGLVDGAVIVEGGRIVGVTDRLDDLPAAVEDWGDSAILPGGVDLHVHLNEPGRTHWEGLETGTRAAVAGGFTTLVDMPLNCDPVVTTVAALDAKRRAIGDHRQSGTLHADVLLHGGLVPGNLDQIEPMIAAGVLGIKAFLVDSGIDGFPAVGERDLRPAMEILARLDVPLLAHAEVDGDSPSDPPRDPPPIAGDPNRYATWLASRPSRFETDAHDLLIRLVRETGCRLHIVHLATADALASLRAARAEGLPITVETCPHYLTFDAATIDDGDARFKCAPPIRSARHREALWGALLDGTVNLVASDHSPAPPARKIGDLMSAWGGIASLQVSLAATWTGARDRGAGLDDLARWMAATPAAVIGDDDRGAIRAGRRADLVVFDPDTEWSVRGADLEHRYPETAYEGRRVRGVVRRTVVAGRTAYPFG